MGTALLIFLWCSRLRQRRDISLTGGMQNLHVNRWLKRLPQEQSAMLKSMQSGLQLNIQSRSTFKVEVLRNK